MNRLLAPIALLVLGVAVTSGCVTQRRSTEASPEASSIEYQLPVTAAQVALNLTITDCGATPKAKGTVTLSPVVRPSPYPEHYFTLKGADLASFTKKRDIKIDLYPNGAIKAINASVADRTGAILANVLKLVTAGLAFDAQQAPPATTLRCNSKTVQGLADLQRIRIHVQGLQKDLASGSAADPAATRKKIDALAAELGRVQSELLTIALTQTLDFWSSATTKGGVIKWKGEDLQKWFDGTGASFVPNFALGWCVQKQSDTNDPTCDGATANGSSSKPTAATEPAATIACASEKCATTVVFREPINAVLTLVAMGADLGVPADAQLQQVTFPMAQWGKVSYFPLSVGFGGSKSLSLALDEFGRRTSFGWSSGARGEDLTGGVQSVVDAAIAFKSARAGEDLAAKKAEVDALETQQKLNKLKRCQAVLDAGGFVCPEQ